MRVRTPDEDHREIESLRRFEHLERVLSRLDPADAKEVLGRKTCRKLSFDKSCAIGHMSARHLDSEVLAERPTLPIGEHHHQVDVPEDRTLASAIAPQELAQGFAQQLRFAACFPCVAEG